jgi:hypothetical protein
MGYAIADFRARFAEFSIIPDATVQLFIDEAILVNDVNRWGTWYALGCGYYAAHHLAIQAKQSAGDSGPILPVRQMTAGSAMIGYGAIKEGSFSEGSFSDNFFQGTSYGQQYLKLMKLAGLGAIVL